MSNSLKGSSGTPAREYADMSLEEVYAAAERLLDADEKSWDQVKAYSITALLAQDESNHRFSIERARVSREMTYRTTLVELQTMPSDSRWARLRTDPRMLRIFLASCMDTVRDTEAATAVFALQLIRLLPPPGDAEHASWSAALRDDCNQLLNWSLAQVTSLEKRDKFTLAMNRLDWEDTLVNHGIAWTTVLSFCVVSDSAFASAVRYGGAQRLLDQVVNILLPSVDLQRINLVRAGGQALLKVLLATAGNVEYSGLLASDRVWDIWHDLLMLSKSALRVQAAVALAFIAQYPEGCRAIIKQGSIITALCRGFHDFIERVPDEIEARRRVAQPGCELERIFICALDVFIALRLTVPELIPLQTEQAILATMFRFSSALPDSAMTAIHLTRYALTLYFPAMDEQLWQAELVPGIMKICVEFMVQGTDEDGVRTSLMCLSWLFELRPDAFHAAFTKSKTHFPTRAASTAWLANLIVVCERMVAGINNDIGQFDGNWVELTRDVLFHAKAMQSHFTQV